MRRMLVAILGIVALNAIGGAGYGLLGAPGIPAQWLEGSPFETYTIPSLYLGVVVGGVHLVAAVLVVRRHRRAAAAGSVAAFVLGTWIVAQVAIIGFVSVLQPIMMGAAFVTLVLSAALWRDEADRSEVVPL